MKWAFNELFIFKALNIWGALEKVFKAQEENVLDEWIFYRLYDVLLQAEYFMAESEEFLDE